MAQKITYNIDVNPGDSVKTLGQLEAELAQINEELKEVPINSEKFADLSKQAQNATKELEKANLSITGLTEQDRILGFQGSIDIVAGSINTLTGAVGLLGLESEEFEKYTAYAANAIAFSEGIRLIAQGAVDLREVLKKATFAQKAFNLATLANPYVLAGAAIVATITAIVSKFETFTNALGNAGINTEIFSKGFDGFLNVFSGVTNVIADKAGRLVAGFIHIFNLDFDKAGDSFKEFFTGSIPELYQEGVNIRQTAKFQKQAEADAEAYAKAFDERLKVFLFQQELKEGAAEAAKIVFEELGDESAMSFVEAFNKKAEEEELFIPEFVDPADLDFEEELDKELNAIKERVEANKEADEEIRASRLQLLSVIEEASDKETAIGKAAFAARQILLFQELTAQTQASLLRIANTGAEASVDASAGFIKTAKAGFPQNIPLLILYGIQIAGLINNLRQSMRSVKGAQSAQTTNLSAPTSPSVSAVPNNIGVAPESIAEQQTVRAYVVSGDVTTSQEAEAKLNAKRTLGRTGGF